MVQCNLTMSCGGTTLLIAYSVTATIVIVILSIVFHHSRICPTTTCDGQTIIEESNTHVDFFNIDDSTSEQSASNCFCPVFKVLGFEIFETIVLVLIAIGMIVGCIKIGTKSKEWIKKYKDMKLARQERKYAAYCNKQASTSSAHNPGPVSRTRTKTRMDGGKLSYQSGDPVSDNLGQKVEMESDEGTA